MAVSSVRARALWFAVVGVILFGPRPGAYAQTAARASAPASPILERHEGDDYTRYELLAPDSAQFRIVYVCQAALQGA